jgi:hypothetical protein
MIIEADDKGHRHGNFPNYYSFHPPQNRLLLLEQYGLMTHIRRGLFGPQGDKATAATSSRRKKPRLEISRECNEIYYCDLGCNEGDLTMAVSSCLSNKEVHNNEQIVRCLGLDLDPTLIQRATDKFSGKYGNDDSEKVFKACNLCSDFEHNNACSSFFASNNTQLDPTPKEMFSLTTIFSTTMWVHIHGGDDGLKKFIERACGWTKQFLLIEPQRSGW